MELVEALVEARRTIDAAELPQELRAPAFEAVLRILVGDVDLRSLASPGAAEPSESASDEIRRGAEGDIMRRIAMKLGVPLEKVQQVYFLDGDSLGLSVPSSALSSAKKEATRQIAVLIAVGRTAAGLDETGWTPAAAIRKVCDDYGKFDVGNFGKTLRAMDDVFQVRGGGPSRQVRAKVPGFERAVALINELTATA